LYFDKWKRIYLATLVREEEKGGRTISDGLVVVARTRATGVYSRVV
jgi:hypothetical protein